MSDFLEFKGQTAKTKKDHYLWVERHRPEEMAEYVGNDSLKESMNRYIKEGDLGHLMLFGPAGTGKTTLAKMLVKKIDCDHLYINASSENGVDTIRQKITGFASSAGFRDLKVIILDECLSEDTIVYVLRNGEEVGIPIKDVDDNNDLVKSFNIKKNQMEWRTFYLWDKGDQEVVEITLDNGEVVVCTLDHKWYVCDKENNPIKVKTKDLLSGKYDYILSSQ